MEDKGNTRWLAFGMGGGDAPPVRTAVAEATKSGATPCGVVSVDNLCRRAVEGRASLPSELYGEASLVVVARRPRAVRALLAFAGVTLNGRDVTWVVAEDEGGAADLVTTCPPHGGEAGGGLPDATDWVPWYPVIDASRCVRCGQCVKFCLFGVYETAPDGLPVVARPEKCKNRCPACARICPAAAIIFPRYEESPFNGDDVKDDDDVRLTAHREDVKRILGDDPIAALRARQERAKARRLVDPAKLDAALAERERHLRAESPEGKA